MEVDSRGSQTQNNLTVEGKLGEDAVGSIIS